MPASPQAADPFHALIETTPDAVVTMDERGLVVFVNPATERLFGYTASELVGQPMTVLMPERFRGAHQIGLARYRVTRERHLDWKEIRLPGLHRDGHEIPVSISFGEYEADGQRFFTGIMRDMTAATEQAQRLAAQTRALERANIELEQTNERLRTAHEEAVAAREGAEQANRAKSEFLTTMSHELRTPLNAIAGYADLLAMGIHGPLAKKQAEAVERIRSNERHLLSLINDVLGFAKLEAGQVRMNTEEVEVPRIVGSLQDIVRPLLVAKGLEYAVIPGPEPAIVRADPERLLQILVNFVGNAIKFTESGRIAVGWDLDGTTITIRVTDTGRGIPADRLDHIFEPFTQLAPRLAGEKAGIGLGLAISRDLAHAMKGTVAAESVEGKGSTFSVTLPRADRPATAGSTRGKRKKNRAS